MNKVVRRAAVVAGAALLIFALLFVSSSPTVGVQSRPSAEDLQAARQVWQQLKLAKGGAAKPVRADHPTVAALSTLASDANGRARMNAGLAHGELWGQASIPLPLGLWINASATATGRHTGFPAYRLKVGRLALPMAAGRMVARLALWLLRMRGATLPPLDEMVQNVTIDRDSVTFTVSLPRKTGLVDTVVAASSSGINHELVKQIFCRIAAEQQAEPATTLSELVRRTFARAPTRNPQNYSRASFVALAFAVVGEQARVLAPQAAKRTAQCIFPDQAILLQGRADLAKHWILSAALTSILGSQTAENLGEWKELHDSLPSGSGFSFVDLAADRAGVRTALLALDSRSAIATQEKLSRASDDSMLPISLLEKPEGLSEASFVERFGSLEGENYREAVAAIDRILAQH